MRPGLEARRPHAVNHTVMAVQVFQVFHPHGQRRKKNASVPAGLHGPLLQVILTLPVKRLSQRPKPLSKRESPPHPGTHRHVHAQTYTTLGHPQSRRSRSLHLCTLIPTETSAALPGQSLGKSLGLKNKPVQWPVQQRIRFRDSFQTPSRVTPELGA